MYVLFLLGSLAQLVKDARWSLQMLEWCAHLLLRVTVVYGYSSANSNECQIDVTQTVTHLHFQ